MATGPCLPIDNGYPVMQTNPFCKDGWGFLKNGECGCTPGSYGWNAAANGCSVKCMGVGPNACPNCDSGSNTSMYLLGGAAALAVLFLLGGRK